MGELSIAGPALGDPVAAQEPSLDEFALILRSSGTTGRPKLVPRTHRNILAFCQAVASARGASASERCLSVCRSVYSQGINALVFTLFAGASLVMLERADVAALAEALRTHRPTYLTTTPAVVRALATGDSELLAALEASPVNRIHASAAPLETTERERLEAALGIPIISGYGLTEASGVAGEPFPRPRWVAGSVGLPWCDIRAIDETGAFLTQGEVGEIVARGPQVFPGYLDDPEANDAAFLPGGWFRTGDLGFLDDRGYLHLTGRIKEVVNRGGESIAPAEIDAALESHPAVAEAAVFSVPDAALGEDLVAAVVLQPDRAASPRELRRWLLDRLSSSKVPRRIRFVTALPRTPTGKVRRGELARRWSEEQG
jgi:acyl-CoA synthetase (AMP-forming)/AMP-acid ligase II